jgi:release factor glutamine methyltransferase
MAGLVPPTSCPNSHSVIGPTGSGKRIIAWVYPATGREILIGAICDGSAGQDQAVKLVAPPGVFSPRSDSRLLARIAEERAAPGMRALDPFCGSGILAIAAARGGAHSTAIDISRRAVWTTRMNAALNRVSVRAIRASDLTPLAGERYDLIVANPPYLPGSIEQARGEARAWEGGPDGRTFIDRLCREAPLHLTERGSVLLIHSSVCGEDRTLEMFGQTGLEAHVIERRRGPVGPLLAAKDPSLASDGVEEILVFEARRTP